MKMKDWFLGDHVIYNLKEVIVIYKMAPLTPSRQQLLMKKGRVCYLSFFEVKMKKKLKVWNKSMVKRIWRKPELNHPVYTIYRYDRI